MNNFLWAWSAVTFIGQEALCEPPIAWQYNYKINYKYCALGNWINSIASLCLFARAVQSWRYERTGWVFFFSFLPSLTKWKQGEFSTNSMGEQKLLLQLKILEYRANFCRRLFETLIQMPVCVCWSNNVPFFCQTVFQNAVVAITKLVCSHSSKPNKHVLLKKNKSIICWFQFKPKTYQFLHM